MIENARLSLCFADSSFPGKQKNEGRRRPSNQKKSKNISYSALGRRQQDTTELDSKGKHIQTTQRHQKTQTFPKMIYTY